MTTWTRKQQARKGFVTVYVTMTALVLIPVVGLAVDFSVLYNVKARLQAAVDAAAIGSGNTLQRSTDLSNSATSVFVDGRDYVGMVTWGGNWKLDYAPSLNFQTSSPNIATAISGIPFDGSSSTNTADGLWQAYAKLKTLNQPGSLNVIVM